MAIQMQSAMFAQRPEKKGDVSHLIGPFGTLPVPASKRVPQGTVLVMPKIAVVVILVGGTKDDRYTVNLALTVLDNEPFTFPVQHKTWPSRSYHRFLLQTQAQDMNVIIRESSIWRVAILVNGQPSGELLLPVHWDDEAPPPLPEFKPR